MGNPAIWAVIIAGLALIGSVVSVVYTAGKYPEKIKNLEEEIKKEQELRKELKEEIDIRREKELEKAYNTLWKVKGELLSSISRYHARVDKLKDDSISRNECVDNRKHSDEIKKENQDFVCKLLEQLDKRMQNMETQISEIVKKINN